MPSGATGPPERGAGWPATAVTLLLAAFAVGLFGQGGYPTRIQVIVGGLVLAAFGAAPGGRPFRMDELRWPPVPAGAVLAAWALADGTLHGAASAAVRPALLVAGIVLVLLTGRRLGPASRDTLIQGTLVLGLLVAATGFARAVPRSGRPSGVHSGGRRSGPVLLP